MLWYFVCVRAEPSAKFSAQHTLDVCCASFGDYFVCDCVSEIFFDASSNVHSSFHNAGTEVFVCLDDYIVVAVFEKMRREYCCGVRLGGLPFLYLDWAVLMAHMMSARIFSMSGLAFLNW